MPAQMIGGILGENILQIAIMPRLARKARRDQEVPTRAALIEKVLGVLDASPAKIFNAVVEADRDLTREELAQLTGYTVTGHSTIWSGHCGALVSSSIRT